MDRGAGPTTENQTQLKQLSTLHMYEHDIEFIGDNINPRKSEVTFSRPHYSRSKAAT